MEISYGSKGIENYIETHIEENVMTYTSPRRFQMLMLEKNDIEGLIRPVRMELDGEVILKYNTCSCYVLDRLFLKLKPDGGFLGLIMEQFEKTLRSIRAFLLNPDDVVLKPEYMFYNWNEKCLKLIYIPGYGENIKKQLKNFLEYVMKIFDHRDEEGVRYMYDMYQLVSEDTFSMDCFSYRLEKNDMYSEVSDELEGDKYNNSPVMTKKQSNSITKLVPLTNGALQEIILSKYDEMILVGRGKRETDYRIPTTQISRVHACIYLKGNGIYVEDRESTNGTFVNSVRIEPLKQEMIKVGDLINFANEEFFAV